MAPAPWVTVFLAQLAATRCLTVPMALMNRIAKRTTASVTSRYSTRIDSGETQPMYSALYPPSDYCTVHHKR